MTEALVNRQRVAELASMARLIIQKVPAGRSTALRNALDTVNRLVPPKSERNFGRFQPPSDRNSEAELRNAARALFNAICEIED